MGYNESVLHTFGRALASGQWRSHAAEIFQRAQQIANQRESLKQQGEQFQQQQNLAQQRFDADQKFRSQYVGPSKLNQSQAALQRAQTGQDKVQDIIAGGPAIRGGLSNLASRLQAQDWADIASGYDPKAPSYGLSSDALRAAQERANKQKINEHAAKQSISNREILERQATMDTFSRLNERSIGTKKTAGLPPEEWDRRRELTKEDQVIKAYITERIKNGATTDEIEAELRQFSIGK